jgi:hypothetical protein
MNNSVQWYYTSKNDIHINFCIFHDFHLLFTFANWMLSWIAIQRKSKCTILFAFTNTCLVHRICRLVKLWSFDQIYGETHVMFNNIINIIRGQMHVHWYYTRTKYRDVSLIQFFASYFNSERTSSFPINFRITIWYQWIQCFLRTYHYQCSGSKSAACYTLRFIKRQKIDHVVACYRPPQTPRWQSVLLVKPEDIKFIDRTNFSYASFFGHHVFGHHDRKASCTSFR